MSNKISRTQKIDVTCFHCSWTSVILLPLASKGWDDSLCHYTQLYSPQTIYTLCVCVCVSSSCLTDCAHRAFNNPVCMTLVLFRNSDIFIGWFVAFLLIEYPLFADAKKHTRSLQNDQWAQTVYNGGLCFPRKGSMESFYACVSPQDFHTEAKEPELPLCLSPVSQGTAVGTTFLPVSQSKPHCSFHPQTHALFSTDNCCLQRCSRRRAGTSDTMRKRKMEPSGHCQLRFPY